MLKNPEETRADILEAEERNKKQIIACQPDELIEQINVVIDSSGLIFRAIDAGDSNLTTGEAILLQSLIEARYMLELTTLWIEAHSPKNDEPKDQDTEL